MGDTVIDTNVLLVASALHPNSPFKDSDVPADQQLKVLNWQSDFRRNGELTVVLDQFWKIMDEYRNKMTDQDFGLQVVNEKLLFARYVDIDFDRDGHGCLPEALAKVVHDRSDRKLVAAALAVLAQGGRCRIVNASDGDWYDWEETLNQAGVVVEQVIDDWCRAKWVAKAKR